jgi:hypothetical protein
LTSADDAYRSTRAAVTRLAGSPDPLPGLRAAVLVRDCAERVITETITRARETGESWTEVGRALGLDDGEREPYDIMTAAYERGAGRSTPRWQATFSFTCGTCGQRVRDNGPYSASPLDCEEGHAEDCARFAEAVRAYRAEWDEEEHDD